MPAEACAAAQVGRHSCTRPLLLLAIWLSMCVYLMQDIISKLLVREPEKRLGSKAGAEEIKVHPFFRDINWALIRHGQPPFIPKRTNRSGEQLWACIASQEELHEPIRC